MKVCWNAVYPLPMMLANRVARAAMASVIAMIPYVRKRRSAALRFPIRRAIASLE